MANIGTKYENQIVQQLTDSGYVAVRTHLSRVIDVIAYNGKHTLFIEAKASRRRTPRSYAFEIRNTKDLCVANGCRDTFYFAVRLRGNKQIWLNINAMKIDKKLTTYDLELAEKWMERKRKMLKQYGYK
jgi:Holliday junction resolvase